MTKSRIHSANGMYHVVIKGNNQNDVFCDEEDNLKFLYILKDVQDADKVDFYAYCLMVNHAHLILRIKKENISQVMRSIMLRYVKWYNKKYERTGRLFEDRFFSNPIATKAYFLAALRYVYNNPVKAGLCRSVAGYRWSSFKQLFLENTGVIPDLTQALHKISLCDASFSVLDDNMDMSMWEPRAHLVDTDAIEIVKATIGIDAWKDIQSISKAEIYNCVNILVEHGASKRQICRVLGITRYNLRRLLK